MLTMSNKRMHKSIHDVYKDAKMPATLINLQKIFAGKKKIRGKNKKNI